MPKGVPNKRPEETPMKFTSFHIPPSINTKNASSSYLKSESQTIWARNAAGIVSVKRKLYENDGDGTVPPAGETALPADRKRGSDIIIIHPGSRYLRIGRATDAYPVTVAHVIARKSKPPIVPPAFFPRIVRGAASTDGAQQKNVDAQADAMDTDDAPPNVVVTNDEDEKDAVPDNANTNDPTNSKIAAIRGVLRSRMRSSKLRAVPNATQVAASYNEQAKHETIRDHNDPYRVDWLNTQTGDDIIVGENVFRIPDPVANGYTVRWPIYGSRFNTRDYTSSRALLGDIETIWSKVLLDELHISARACQELSAILVVPDYFEKHYIQELVHLLLVQMRFKRVCIQQEAICAAFGAGLSTACVIDIGAVKTSVSCVEEGLVLPETRIALNYGGDDITEFLAVLLGKIHFPYRTMDLTRMYDWNMMVDLKERMCTLAEVDVALNVTDFFVRAPGRDTEKYTVKTYDEPTVAPMCIFEPSIIDFDAKREGLVPLWNTDSVEDIDIMSDPVTNAMVISTAHLAPAPAPHPQQQGELLTTAAGAAGSSADGSVTPLGVGEETPAVSDTSGTPKRAATPTKGGGELTKPSTRANSPVPTPTAPAASTSTATAPTVYPGGFTIDVRAEASKLGLDAAVIHSIRAAGAADKVKKLLQVVLIVGGSALVPGLINALEARLQAMAMALMPGTERVQVIPAPKEIDPRVLAWKGVSVLGKLDALGDLWVQEADWEMLGIRAVKERSFFLTH
ncbi:hypothetical protein BOTBODRAFT_160982 [Botryobasidium botryosum FD-172 SS1]|uniref:Uncharacterized protein n=1 Tax=Botryobasidium botryosum (strain FD-172 SS1) TaxID=930990 RepID=A0A067MBA0_BOTB1|nr:hypothetical protein BOTBODRAFT_160982 [Botryobasidium botryosum FD-172 SS1]